MIFLNYSCLEAGSKNRQLIISTVHDKVSNIVEVNFIDNESKMSEEWFNKILSFDFIEGKKPEEVELKMLIFYNLIRENLGEFIVKSSKEQELILKINFPV
jgi:hypothetical protein